MRTGSVWWVCLLFFGWGCAPAELTREQLISYVTDDANGLRKNIETGAWSFDMIYQPVELAMYHDWQSLSVEERKQTQKTYDSLDYFLLKLKRDDRDFERAFAGTDQYNQVISYFGQAIQQDLALEVAGMELKPLSVLYTPQFGMGDASTVLVVFSSRLRSQSGSTARVRWHDTQFGSGVHSFSFDLTDLKNIPALKYPL
jgi:hypothetical protein